MVALAPRSNRTYECARCGKRQRADRMVFSTHTRLHFCAQLDACGRRVKRGPIGRRNG